MSDHFELRLAQAIRDLQAQPDRSRTLDRMVDVSLGFFDSADHVGISLVEDGLIRTPAASDERLRELDEAQYDLGEGPCLEAIRAERTVIVDDLAADPRWPSWGRAMADGTGVRSSLSLLLFTRDERSHGALNIYSRRPAAFTDEDVAHGQTIAAMCAVALAHAIHDEQLATALASRTVIGRAVGVLMERYGLDDETAMGVMRRMSSQDNRKLRDVAVEVVGDRPREGGESSPPGGTVGG